MHSSKYWAGRTRADCVWLPALSGVPNRNRELGMISKLMLQKLRYILYLHMREPDLYAARFDPLMINTSR